MSNELIVGVADNTSHIKSDTERCLNTIVGMLKNVVDMDLWMFTTAIENDWIILAASENPYGVQNGDVLPWDESVCSRMVDAKGPNIVPKIRENELYNSAPIVKKLPICAYIGFTIKDENNQVLGTLCAIDREEKKDFIESSREQIKPLLEIGRTLINQSNLISRFSKALSVFEAQTTIDSTTGLPNQEAFFELASTQKAESDKLACPLGIIIIEISGLSLRHSGEYLRYENLVCEISNDLKALLRETDIIAKLDGSKFGMLFVNAENRFVSAMVIKISNTLAKYKLKVSIGADICRTSDAVLQSIENANANKLI